MNARNAVIAANNSTRSVALVNQKYATKLALQRADIAVAPTLGVASNGPELRHLVESLPDAWAMKPDRGRAGGGILISLGLDDEGRWRSAGGGSLLPDDVYDHGREILHGAHSMGGVDRDLVLAEPLLVAHPDIDVLSSGGLPDVRVLVYRGRILAGMLRVATVEGEGKANLHKGGIGIAIDVETGVTTGAMRNGEPIMFHPDTGVEFRVLIPFWDQIVEMSQRCGEATGLGYLGADIVIDRELGPVVIEVNAHPGLEIQNVCATPLGHLV